MTSQSQAIMSSPLTIPDRSPSDIEMSCSGSPDAAPSVVMTTTPAKKPSTKARKTSVLNSNSAKMSPDKVTKSTSKPKPFRFKWMKKVSSTGVPFVQNGSDDGEEDLMADSFEEKGGLARTPSTMGKGKHVYKGGKTLPAPGVEDPFKMQEEGIEPATVMPRQQITFQESDTEKEEHDGADEDIPAGDEVENEAEAEEEDNDGAKAWMDEHGKIGTYVHPEVPKALNTMEKARKKAKGPADPNGRFVGRKLVLWHRPRMIEKLLLHVQYECHKAGMRIPWDDIVHRLSPGSSGPSAVQMLNKMRDVLITEGHLIPPILGKSATVEDPNIRGYARDMAKVSPTAIRDVYWNEEYADRKENLVVPGLIRGSGKYRAVAKERGDSPASAQAAGGTGGRNRTSSQAQAAGRRATKESVRKSGPAGRNVFRSGSRIKREPVSDDEIDPADLPSDEEFNPEAIKKSKRRNQHIPRKYLDDSPTPKSSSMGRKMKMIVGHDGRPSLTVKLQLSPESLSKYPAGIGGVENTRGYSSPMSATSRVVMEARDVARERVESQIRCKPAASRSYQEESEEDEEEEEGLKQVITYDVKQPRTNFNPQLGAQYKSVTEHGTLQQWSHALKTGQEPTTYGTNHLEELWIQGSTDRDFLQKLPQDQFQALMLYKKVPLNDEKEVKPVESYAVTSGVASVHDGGEGSVSHSSRSTSIPTQGGFAPTAFQQPASVFSPGSYGHLAQYQTAGFNHGAPFGIPADVQQRAVFSPPVQQGQQADFFTVHAMSPSHPANFHPSEQYQLQSQRVPTAQHHGLPYIAPSTQHFVRSPGQIFDEAHSQEAVHGSFEDDNMSFENHANMSEYGHDEDALDFVDSYHLDNDENDLEGAAAAARQGLEEGGVSIVDGEGHDESESFAQY